MNLRKLFKSKQMLFVAIALTSITITSCTNDDEPPVSDAIATCNDGIRNQGEKEIDCGGPNCQPCPDEIATCNDGIQNGDETGIDKGGSCAEIITISGELTEDTKWTANNLYLLAGKVVVGAGKTLTIEPGTIIKGMPGSGSLASALIVQRGATILAKGTADDPIIFTAEADNIGVGQKSGTNLDESQRGLWGGIIVLGRASGSFKGDVSEVQIEGIPADDTYGLYGPGDALNDNDNSGVLQYISIRHGGALIGEGNEINGLTLGSVGSGTLIDHIEIVANVDDGVEFFGGTVNASNLLVWAQGDDALDIDQAYSGTIDNAVVILGEASDHAFEIDGPEGSLEGSFTLKNTTIIGSATAADGEYADYRSNAMGTTSNIYAYGFPENKDVELDANDVAQNFLDGKLIFDAWQVVGFNNGIFSEKVKKDATGNDTESKIILDPSFTERAATWTTQVEKGAQTVGADTSVFNWTFYAISKGTAAF